MRQILSTALVALVVSLLTVTVTGALAQEPAQPAPEAVTHAGVNADTVDGKHAVSATSKKSARRNKLVATDSKGLLPSNIVKPKWPLIQQKPAAFVDGQITWDEVQNKPALGGGPVAWGDIQNKPAGFADGADNEGVTGLKVIYVWGGQVAVTPGTPVLTWAECPEGSVVVGGGYYHVNGPNQNLEVYKSDAEQNVWLIGAAAFNNNQGVQAFATCLAVDPGSAIKTATKAMRVAKSRRK